MTNQQLIFREFNVFDRLNVLSKVIIFNITLFSIFAAYKYFWEPKVAKSPWLAGPAVIITILLVVGFFYAILFCINVWLSENKINEEVHQWPYEVFKQNGEEIQIIKSSFKFLGIGDVVTITNRVMFKDEEIDVTINRFKIHNNKLYHECTLPNGEKVFQISLNNFKNIKNCQTTIDATKDWWKVENARRDKLPRFLVRVYYPESKYNTGDVVNSFGADFIFDKQKYDFFKRYPDVFEEIEISLAHALNKTGMFDN